MAHKVTVRIGGDAGSTVWNATSQVAIFDDGLPLLDAGHMFGGDGNACQFQFVVDDDIGEIPRADLTKNVASHNVVTVTEDASGTELWLARGRIADKGWGRKAIHYGDARGALVTVDDGNTDFRGLALVADWVRPAESGRARVLAALAAFCNASPRLTTVIGTHLVAAGGEVTMPAKTYKANTDLPEVFRDCATVEGKVWGAVIHHSGGSHLCCLYADEEDWTVYPSTLSITDDEPDLITSFPPSWRQGDAALEVGGDNPLSHLVSRYGPGEDSFVVAANTARITSYDYWAAPFNDSLSVTPAEAATRAGAILGSRGREHVTHQPTIRLPADKVHLVEAGMSIQIKSAASMGGLYLGTWQTRRIAQAKKEMVSPQVGAVPAVYDVHLQLDRPEKKLAEAIGQPVGPQPPSEGTAGTAPTVTASGGNTSSSGYDSILVSVGAAQGGLFLAWLTHDGLTARSARYQSNGSDAGTSVAMTLIGTIEHTTDSSGTNTDNDTIYIFHKASPAASINSGFCEVDFTGTQNGAGLGWWVVDSAAVPVVATAQGTGTRSTVTPSAGASDLVLDTTGWRIWTLGDASNTPTLGSGQTSDWAIAYNHSAGQPDGAWAGGHKVGAGAREWSWATSTNWVAATITIPGTGTAGDFIGSVGGTGEGAVGDADHYIPVGSTLEHNNISEGGPYHEAADVVFTPTGTISSTNVQDAIVEAAGGGLDWFDVTTYGATGNGTTNDFAAINLAIAAYNAAGGGVLYFPATADDYLVSAGLTTLTAPGIVRGDGASSLITCSSATAHLFTSSAGPIGVSFRDLRMENTHGTPTAGSAIRVSSGGNSATYHNLRIDDFWVGIRHEDGASWAMDHLRMNGIRKYGIHISNATADEGDWSIDNSVIAASTHSPDAAIRIDSSGGGKISNLKVNGSDPATGYDYGIDVVFASVQSSVLTVVGSSIENVSADAIRVTTTGTGRYGAIALSGIQVGLHGNNTGYVVKLDAASPGGYSASGGIGIVTIDGIVAYTDGTARAAIGLTNTDRVTIGDLALEGFSARYTQTGATNITDAGAGTLDSLTDVTITGAATGDMLRYNGTAWVDTPGRWEVVTNGVDILVWDGANLLHEWTET